MCVIDITDEEIKDLYFSLIYPFVAIKNILNFFLCEFTEKK